MKKNMLIVSTSGMQIGGIETSLIGLLDALDYEKYDVDLFLFSHSGELYPQIDSRVHIFPQITSCHMMREPIVDVLKKGQLGLTAMRVWNKFFCHLQGQDLRMMDMNFRVLNHFLPDLEKQYDVALGFFGPHDFLVRHVQAKVKAGWIHTDYSKVPYDIEYHRHVWEALDYVVGVSEECGVIFGNLLPSVKDRILTIENILPQKLVLKRAKELDVSAEMSALGMKLLTAGRFSPQKKIDEVPRICSLLRKKGLDVTWYIIGYGPDEELIRQRIAEAHMEAYVKILGKKENPYPYMEACDVYVQPSRYEGKCVAVREAQMLGKPVIITNYPTAASQLEDGVDGKIVPLEIEACAEEMASILKNPALLASLRETCMHRDYSNVAEVRKIDAWMEN